MAEITSKVKLSYLKNGAWKSFSAKIQSSIDGLKIQTSNSAYYLQYRTWNQGKTAFYPYVKSTVNDYAGMDGRPVQLLQIQALKSDGTQLDSGIVVMFRTYTDGKWLPWVSNADPKWMESVQKKYKLGGTLDTSGAYAGLSGKNATGVEIRVFEEGPLGNFEGGEVKAGFSYMADSESNWTEFSSAALAPYMDGIKIQTPTNKGYYLTYKTWNEGKENYYPAVKSTVNDYAGVPGRHIQRLAISAYKNDGTVLTSGVIVMYRAFVDGRWLPWVSNADAQWMRSIKEKHELDGTLDTSSGYAGISGKNLGGVEIRIFEDDAPNAGSDRFEGDEIPLELGYIANNNTWHSFTKSVKASPMDGIKIQTSASDFYLAYKTWNEGKGNYYPEVKSTENDYAGMAGRPIQRVSISACSADGTRLDSGVVVMYRAFVDGRWLPWVSNAGAEHMKNVQSRFNLDGTLDTISNYAGISGKNIAGLEIRAFKGELDEGIQDLPGTESTPAMSYMYSNIWQSFPGSILHDPIEGVKIQTASSKPYYFTYKTWNEGKTWYYPAVKSTEDDYAGMSGRPIQRLNIQVFRNDGTALESGVVVMYRVYVEGRWLPWVSNATREWMQSVQDKYQLDGTLDSTGTYAGISGKNISGLEIRVYEENQITDTPITPTGKHKIIDVDFITQIGTYPTGCESVTAVMALHHINFNLSVKNFINHYLDMQPYPFDPFETFGGDPFSDNGWGCYAPVIKKALDKALVGLPYYAEELSGVSLQKLCTDYIDKNIPVILWATMGMRASKTITWTYNGRRIEWVQPEHCLLLVGYDEKHYIFNDPQKSGPRTYYTKEAVEKAYKAQFSQAVVILRKEEEPENPPYEVIADAKKAKYIDILRALEVPSNNIDKGKFGLFREDNVEASVTEIVGNVKITYSCGANTKVHTDYSTVTTLNVENGELTLSALDRIQINTNATELAHFYSQHGVEPPEDPFILIEAVAAEVGNGSISFGANYSYNGINVVMQLFYKVLTEVEITPNYTEEMYVVVEMEPVDLDPPESPTESFNYVPSMSWDQLLAMLLISFAISAFLGPIGGKLGSMLAFGI